MQAWRTWVALWDLREHPRSLAAIRVALGLVMLYDLGEVLRLGLVVQLLGVQPAGGFSPVLSAGGTTAAWWATALPPTPASAWLLWGSLTACVALWTIGVATRPALLMFVVLSAQWELLLPNANRAIETLIRIAAVVLACSASDRTLSLTAWWRTGSLFGDGAPIPAWPRHLLVLQLVLMYFLAGVQKFSLPWSPAQEFSALYLIVQDPAVANADYGWMAGQPWYGLTQVGTAVTMVWEWGAPLLLWVYWCRFTADRPGRLRALTLLWPLHLGWAAIGVVFHVAIAALLELGIFPWAMLALYFAFVHPDELARITSIARSRTLPSKAA